MTHNAVAGTTSNGGADWPLVWRASRAMLPDGERAADIGVSDGRIAAVGPYGSLTGGTVVAYRSDVVLLPGLVDTHVHVNEPGRTQWEGFATATAAAAAGGVTTLIDMPLNSIPPTVDVAALLVKRGVARTKAAVDVGFWGGAVPAGLGTLKSLHDNGVFGFKCFLLPSGVDEFPPIADDDVLPLLEEIAACDALLVVHAEDSATIEAAPEAAGRRYDDFLASRPDVAETRAIARLLAAARATGARVHILHLSSSAAVALIADAKQDGVRVTAETCPHYLTFAAEDVPDGATEFKCCPPVRSSANRERLWRALARGVLDVVVSDHSPCTPDLKRSDTGDFGDAWGGISSLQLGLSAVWTGARARGVSLAHVVRWMASGPADLVGLTDKGRLTVGAAADACVFAPNSTFVVDPQLLQHRNPLTPYAGMRLTGVVRETWLAGRRVVAGEAPHGRLLARTQS
jgi:allantoinase